MASRVTRSVAAAVTPTYFASASLRSQVLSLTARYAVRPVLGLWAQLPFDLYPPNLPDLLASKAKLPAGTRVEDVELPGCSAHVIRAANVADDTATRDGVILYLHGGAFLTCGLSTHRRLVAQISAASHLPVLSVGYRQMPEAPIATSVADGLDGFAWLMEQGYRPEEITIAGDSAGGYLSFVIARAVLDAGWGRPAGVVALSPVLRIDPTHRYTHRNVDRCQLFPAVALDRFAAMIHKQNEIHGVDKVTCPVDMDLTGLPPTLIQSGSREILLADTEIMASRLAAAGVPVDFQVWSKQVHVFQAAASWVPEARAAVAEMARFVSEAMAEAEAAEAASTGAAQRRVRWAGR